MVLLIVPGVPEGFLQFPLPPPETLKDKLRHSTIFKSLFEQKFI